MNNISKELIKYLNDYLITITRINKRQLQSFLGACNYYRQFNVRQSKSVDSLRELLKKDAIWEWTLTHTKAFQQLKRDFQDT